MALTCARPRNSPVSSSSQHPRGPGSLPAKSSPRLQSMIPAVPLDLPPPPKADCIKTLSESLFIRVHTEFAHCCTNLPGGIKNIRLGLAHCSLQGLTVPKDNRTFDVSIGPHTRTDFTTARIQDASTLTVTDKC